MSFNALLIGLAIVGLVIIGFIAYWIVIDRVDYFRRSVRNLVSAIYIYFQRPVYWIALCGHRYIAYTLDVWCVWRQEKGRSQFIRKPILYFVKIYFILGLAMLLFVLWDYKNVPKTASRLTKQAGENESGFSLITNAIRNLMLMALFAFFLWPVVVGMELFGNKEK